MNIDFEIEEYYDAIIEDREHKAFAKGFKLGLEVIIELGYDPKHFLIIKNLSENPFNISEVAREINIPRTTLQYQIKKYKKIYKKVKNRNN